MAPSLSSARERAWIPSAKSVPAGSVVSASRSSAARATFGLADPCGRLDELGQAPHGRIRIDVVRRHLAGRRRRLVVAARGRCRGRQRPTGRPSPRDPPRHASAIVTVASIKADASASLPCKDRSRSAAKGGSWLPVAAATLSLSAMSASAPARSPFHILSIATDGEEQR